LRVRLGVSQDGAPLRGRADDAPGRDQPERPARTVPAGDWARAAIDGAPRLRNPAPPARRAARARANAASRRRGGLRGAGGGQGNRAALTTPARPMAARRSGSPSRAIVMSAHAVGSSFGMITASPPPSMTQQNPRLSDTIIGVPHAIASSSVTPNEAIVVGQRYRSAAA